MKKFLSAVLLGTVLSTAAFAGLTTLGTKKISNALAERAIDLGIVGAPYQQITKGYAKQVGSESELLSKLGLKNIDQVKKMSKKTFGALQDAILYGAWKNGHLNGKTLCKSCAIGLKAIKYVAKNMSDVNMAKHITKYRKMTKHTRINAIASKLRSFGFNKTVTNSIKKRARKSVLFGENFYHFTLLAQKDKAVGALSDAMVAYSKTKIGQATFAKYSFFTTALMDETKGMVEGLTVAYKEAVEKGKSIMDVFKSRNKKAAEQLDGALCFR